MLNMCDNPRENCKVNDIFEQVCRTLSRNHEVTVTSKKFSALNTNAERVVFAGELLQKYSLFPQLIEETKNDEISVKYRQEGNDAFKKKDDFSAWSLYTKSILYATNSSECLGLAYANRSAVLYEKKMYKQCLEDITNAFKNNYPKHLHDKLIQREHKARELLSSQVSVKYCEKIAALKNANKQIQCASAKVEIRKSKTLGRHVVAVKKIRLGEIIALEQPFVQILLKDYLKDHCYHCFELCYSLTPCDTCVYAMFCSKKCQDLSWNLHHRYECAILPTLYNLNMSKLNLAALRVAIVARTNYGDIENYTQDENNVYKSQCYEEIHFLETNTHLRKTSNLFPKAVTAAILSNMVEKGTSLFNDFEDRQRDQNIFDELIMRHLLTGPTNFHEISECAETESGFVKTEEIGSGAYAFLSLLNHSCTPNVVRHCHGSEIVLRSIKPIQKGAELLDNYGYHYAVMNKTDRQRELQRQYFFNCICEACGNNWPLYSSLPQRGMLELDELDSLMRGDRAGAVTILAHLLSKYDSALKRMFGPSKVIADLQETIKQCFALLGNRKAKF